MTTETPCERCGTFLPPGRSRLCEPCAKKEADQRAIRRTARLMALCLAVASIVLMSVEAVAVFRSNDGASVLGMIGFGLVSGGGLLAGSLGVLWRRSPVPGWAAVALMLVCPSNWLWALVGGRGARVWGTVFALAVTAALLAVALGVRLRQQRRAAGMG